VLDKVRTEAVGKEALSRLPRSYRGNVSFEICDFLSSASVQRCAEALQRLPQVDVLVLNAGVYGGQADAVWMCNQLGPFLLTKLLLPQLRNCKVRFELCSLSCPLTANVLTGPCGCRVEWCAQDCVD
jgi:NAD(P)-dependent dehydrogenase (short-subunit alcohol dehydrogenase family)